MNILNAILGKSTNENEEQKESENDGIIISNSKELNINKKEEKRVQYIKSSTLIKFELKVHGKSIFQNMILTVTAELQGEPIPLKCIWKRVNRTTEVIIKGINSFSYMPTAEDLGYIIEVEAEALDY